MPQFFETIKVLEGIPLNIEYHLRRVVATAKHFNLQYIAKEFENTLANFKIENNEVYKLRIDYTEKIEKIDVQKYHFTNPKFYKIIDIADYHYNYKFVNRHYLEKIQRNLPENTIAILTKNRLITDSTYANLVLEIDGAYFTPSQPLLQGTKRQQYLDNHRITLRDLTTDDLFKMEKFYLINAMINLEDNP
jgi:4-amino-4-deoxychorismate lyase